MFVASPCLTSLFIDHLQDQVSQTVSLPALPGLRQLRQQLLPHYASLRQGETNARHRPVYACTREEREAADQFSQVLRAHLSTLMGDMRSHIITNVNLGKKAGILMKVH